MDILSDPILSKQSGFGSFRRGCRGDLEYRAYSGVKEYNRLEVEPQRSITNTIRGGFLFR